MPRIVIVGGGFAGVWSAAAAAARSDGTLQITLVAPNEQLVLRPRMYEPNPHEATVPLKRILGPIGVEQVQASVTKIDVAGHQVITEDGTAIDYDRLVLATGSQLVRPDLPGAEYLFDVDTLAGASKLSAHLRDRSNFTAVVVGAGFVGLEIATELASRGRVVLVERNDVVGPELGPGPRQEIEAALDQLGIEKWLNTTVTALDKGWVQLSDGNIIEADAVVWCAGMQANPLTAQVPGNRDKLGRLNVNQQLRVTRDVFATGDVAAAYADADHLVLQSCQHAVPLGKTAGHNAAADLLGLSLVDFTPGPYVTCLDLGAAGAIFTTGWDRSVKYAGEDGKKRKQWINQLIKPPVDNADELLASAREIYQDVEAFSETVTF